MARRQEVLKISVSWGVRHSSTVAAVNGRINLDPQQFRTRRRVGHDLHSADHPRSDRTGVTAHWKTHTENMLLQMRHLQNYDTAVPRIWVLPLILR